MKKILFKTICVSSLFAAESFAQSVPNELLQRPNTPVVTVGGFLNFTAAARSQDAEYEKSRLPDAMLNDDRLIDSAHAGTDNRYSNRVSFANDSEIYIKVGAISDSGLKYGAIVELEADTTTDGRGEGFNADKTFIFTESQIGKFEFGNNNAANQKMKVGPAVFARATGGINGKYLEHINFPMLAHSTNAPAGATAVCQGGVGIDVNGDVGGAACENVKLPRFILIPQSPVAHGGYAKGFYNRVSDNDYLSDSAGNVESSYGSFNRNSNSLIGYKNGSFGQMEDATKISYYTPRINGWQGGVSFTPDTGDNGTSASISGGDSGDVENVISWGLNYSNNLGNLGVAFSVTGENGTFENSEILPVAASNQISRSDLAAYDAGLMLTYFGFTIGGSYGYWGDSLQPDKGIYSCDYDNTSALADQDCTSTTSKKFADAQYYTGGAAYEFGPFAASLTYLVSDFQKNKYKAMSFGIDYKIARGLMPYLEVTKFKFESNQPKSDTLTDQASISNDSRQLRDNQGYVALVGVIFAF